jgi:sugar lactone lactonase YvrE
VSLLRHRLLIAWLHFLQPLARVTGRLRGSLSPPPVVEPARATRLTWKSPSPRQSDAFASARLLVGGTPEEHFWSETWTSLDALLTEVTGLLRAARPARFVDVDDGFRAGRDVSLGVGCWGWLDVRALLEEHGGSRCLLRIGLRLRPAARGIVLLVALLVALVVMPESLIARWPWLSIAAPIGLAVAFGRAAWQTAGAVALSRHAVQRAAHTTGLTPIPMHSAPRPRWQFTPGLPMMVQRVHGLLLVLLAAGAVEAAGSLLRDANSLRVTRAIAAARESDSARTVDSTSAPVITGDVAVAPDGNLLVADSRRGVIHRLDMTALNEPMRVSSVVSDTDDRQMLSSDWRIHSPAAISIGRDGDLYVADARGNRVSRIDRRSGRIVVLAGSGASGYDGDLKPAITASLSAPTGVAVAANGDVYIADSGNHRVRVVSAITGLIRTVAGTGQTAATGPDDEDLGDGRPAAQAQLDTPSDVALAPNGDIYIADMGHNRVRVIDAASGVISTVAGNGQAGSAGDGGPARGASLAGPVGLALSWSKRQVTVYVAEHLGGSIRAITPGGGITTIGTPRRFKAPSRLAYRSGGWLYVVDERAVTVVNVSRGRTVQMAAALTRAPRHEIVELPSRAHQ